MIFARTPKGPVMIFIGFALILIQLGLVTSAVVAGDDPGGETSLADTGAAGSGASVADPSPVEGLTGETGAPASGTAAAGEAIQAQTTNFTETNQPVAVAQTPPQRVEADLGLEEFIARVADGQPGVVRGLYVPGLLALRIVDQPVGDPAYISSEADTATLFQSAGLFGAVGLLAHNYLSGSLFYDLAPGQELSLVYGDGSVRRYRLETIAPFERLTLGNLTSDFLDLQTGMTLSAQQVFEQFYNGDVLTLQTCLEKDGLLNWGVTFFVAVPIE